MVCVFFSSSNCFSPVWLSVLLYFCKTESRRLYLFLSFFLSFVLSLDLCTCSPQFSLFIFIHCIPYSYFRLSNLIHNMTHFTDPYTYTEGLPMLGSIFIYFGEFTFFFINHRRNLFVPHYTQSET